MKHHIKDLPTKPTTVHGKKKVFLRNQHVKLNKIKNKIKNIISDVSPNSDIKHVREKIKELKSVRNSVVDTDEWNGYVDEFMNKLTDNGQNLSHLREFASKYYDTDTVRDFINYLTKDGKVNKHLIKELNQAPFIYKIGNNTLHPSDVMYMENPKSYLELLKKTGVEVKDFGNINKMLKEWKLSSSSVYSLLLRRSIHNILGFKYNKKDDKFFDNGRQLYKPNRLTKDKLPKEFVNSVKEIYKKTQKELKGKKIGKLYRGVWLDADNKPFMVGAGMVSTTKDEKIANIFSGVNYDDAYKIKTIKSTANEHQVFFNKEISKYIDKLVVNDTELEGGLGINLVFKDNDDIKKHVFHVFKDDTEKEVVLVL